MDENNRRKMKNALASTRIEGFEATEQTERDCIHLMCGEISVSDLVKGIISHPAMK